MEILNKGIRERTKEKKIRNILTILAAEREA